MFRHGQFFVRCRGKGRLFLCHIELSLLEQVGVLSVFYGGHVEEG